MTTTMIVIMIARTKHKPVAVSNNPCKYLAMSMK